jgi:hypothetical protein
MSARDGYDGDELRALAVALDAIDPADADQWDGDERAFATSVEAGRKSLEARGLARFARDGSAVIEAEDANEIQAFLAPQAVIEAWILDAERATGREWYLGATITVAATPADDEQDREEQDFGSLPTTAVFRDVAGFVDLGHVDGRGETVRLDASALLEFAGSALPAATGAASSRLIAVSAAWERSGASREMQILDAGTGGLWLVADADPAAETDLVDLVPLTRSKAIELLYGTLAAE